MSLESTRSANSTHRSKRSFNSISSNNSDDSKTKKMTKQKTLGMAWGANSISSSRSSFRSSPFSGFGSYMSEKNRKLRNQFDAEASGSSHGDCNSGRPIFHGVAIFVDGFTVPSSQELRGYMLKHGGRYENYFSRKRVTHIICSNLPDSKVKNLRSFSGGLPVVKPSWILDSVASNKLLSWVPYQLDQLASNQPKLSSFFALKCNTMHEEVLESPSCQVKPQTDESSLKNGTSCDLISVDVAESTKSRGKINEPCDFACDNSNEIQEEPARDSGKYLEINFESTNLNTEEEGSVVRELHHASSSRPSASASSTCFDDNLKESPDSAIPRHSNPRHSTTGDPNFVENYFKDDELSNIDMSIDEVYACQLRGFTNFCFEAMNSRLHFIGTWRHRYRKRFSGLANIFQCSSLRTNISSTPRQAAVIHVDMDCFFVSVVIRNRTDLQDKAVAVCHSDNPKGTAEISSANYPARGYGIKAGIFVRDAKALCPHLVIVPYDFEAYQQVADQFYDILHKHCNKVQAVSCDEAFLDVSELDKDPRHLASNIRKNIFEATGCTASAGISVNMLMARLATRTAKPDGQFFIPPERVDDYLDQLPIETLPGVGYVLEEKLKKQNVTTCGQLRMISKDSLQKDFGMKTGEMLWNYSRGLDDRLVGVIQESKSVGAEVNWGVRFKDLKDSQHFLLDLCKEVSLRLQGCGVRGRTFTLKIKKRRKDAEEPAKYMGCGDCENLSHSTTVPVATDDVEVIQRITKKLFGFFHIDVKEIRGVGLLVSKLESVDSLKQGAERSSLKAWFASASASTGEHHISSVKGKGASRDTGRKNFDGTESRTSASLTRSSNQMGNNSSNSDPAAPPLCHLDVGVIESLPPELFSELNEIYGGKLVNYIAENKCKIGSKVASLDELQKGERSSCSDLVAIDSMPTESKVGAEVVSMPISGACTSNEVALPAILGSSDLMPSSLSQVDASVLQQLPEELKVDVLESLPAHRKQEFSVKAAFDYSRGSPQQSLDIQTDNFCGPVDCHLSNHLWFGNPPQWVIIFKTSTCSILNRLGEMYENSGSTGNLSLVLQRTFVESQLLLEMGSDFSSETVNCLCELLKQYIKLKIESDIEEIYLSFRLLRRLITKSKLFLQVYDAVFPYLQASVGESYGGNLHIP